MALFQLLRCQLAKCQAQGIAYEFRAIASSFRDCPVNLCQQMFVKRYLYYLHRAFPVRIQVSSKHIKCEK